jgi:hypothetical protein
VTKVQSNKGLSSSRKQTILRPNFPCFVLLIPNFTVSFKLAVRFLLKHTDINGTCASVPQRANNFCEPSDVLTFVGKAVTLFSHFVLFFWVDQVIATLAGTLRFAMLCVKKLFI